MSLRRPTPAVAVVGMLLLAAAVLLAVELGLGALRYGSGKLADPCRPEAFSGHGLDAAVQRVVLDGLNGAACRLGTTREELVLSFGSNGAYTSRRWDRHTVEVAVRAGMLAAVDKAEERDEIPGLLATVLRSAINAAPLDQLIRGAIGLRDLLG